MHCLYWLIFLTGKFILIYLEVRFFFFKWFKKDVRWNKAFFFFSLVKFKLGFWLTDLIYHLSFEAQSFTYYKGEECYGWDDNCNIFLQYFLKSSVTGTYSTQDCKALQSRCVSCFFQTNNSLSRMKFLNLIQSYLVSEFEDIVCTDKFAWISNVNKYDNVNIYNLPHWTPQRCCLKTEINRELKLIWEFKR